MKIRVNSWQKWAIAPRCRVMSREHTNLILEFNQKLKEFRDQVKALERTTDPAVRRSLPVPYEMVLYYECERRRVLPFPGNLMDQPHLLLLCFRIIEAEAAQAEIEQRKLAEINRQQVEIFAQQAGINR